MKFRAFSIIEKNKINNWREHAPPPDTNNCLWDENIKILLDPNITPHHLFGAVEWSLCEKKYTFRLLDLVVKKNDMAKQGFEYSCSATVYGHILETLKQLLNIEIVYGLINETEPERPSLLNSPLFTPSAIAAPSSLQRMAAVAKAANNKSKV